MTAKRLIKKTWLVGPIAAIILGAGALIGCATDTGIGEGREAGEQTVSREISESGNERGGNEARGEQRGSTAEGGEGGGESGPDGPEGTEAAMEAAMSSPITPLDQAWNGALGGLAVSASYDAATQTVHTTAQNTTQQTLCYVQSEPHLKSGTQTVGELGPGKMGDLNPGQSATSGLPVSAEPELAGVSYDGYVIHMEVFDCGGPGPVAHTGAEGGSGEGAGGEGHGPGGEGGGESARVGGESGSEGAEGGSGGGEEGSGAMLAPDETFDATRGGARLVMSYDASINAFTGMVQNTTASVLTDVRIEVHLSNGAELGPTNRVDMAPGEMLGVVLPATPESFTGWVPHAEVGSGEDGGESGGEHGAASGSGVESGGEHGSGGEGRGEHGSGREGRGGS